MRTEVKTLVSVLVLEVELKLSNIRTQTGRIGFGQSLLVPSGEAIRDIIVYLYSYINVYAVTRKRA